MTGSDHALSPLDVRRKKLAYRAAHRGTKEMDLIVGGYVARHIASMTPAELDDLERIIEIPDADLDAWLTGKAPLPEEQKSDLLMAILGVTYTPGDYT